MPDSIYFGNGDSMELSTPPSDTLPWGVLRDNKRCCEHVLTPACLRKIYLLLRPLAEREGWDNV